MKKIIIGLVVILSSCTMDSELGKTIPIFLMGQSNAKSALAKQIEITTGEPTISINHGGQAIKDWFVYPFYWINLDIAFLRDRNFDCFVWFQGEADTQPDFMYEVFFRELLEKIGADKDTCVIIVKVYMELWDCTIIRGYQDMLADKETNWFTVDTIDLPRPTDGIHLEETGYVTLAERINDIFINFKK